MGSYILTREKKDGDGICEDCPGQVTAAPSQTGRLRWSSDPTPSGVACQAEPFRLLATYLIEPLFTEAELLERIQVPFLKTVSRAGGVRLVKVVKEFL